MFFWGYCGRWSFWRVVWATLAPQSVLGHCEEHFLCPVSGLTKPASLFPVLSRETPSISQLPNCQPQQRGRTWVVPTCLRHINLLFWRLLRCSRATAVR